MRKIVKLKLLNALILLGCSTMASAANFQTFEQSATLLGQADAGTTVTDDPSVQFYNPAATAFFDHTAFGASGIYVRPNIGFQPTSATDFTGAPVTGNAHSPEQNAVIPASFLIVPLNNQVVAGLGVTVPFGLSSNYGNNDSIARYFATQSQVETVNINPSLAFRLTNKFSAGFGLDVQYMKAVLNQAANSDQFIPYWPSTDLYFNNTASDWAVGWNAGLFYKLRPTTKIGLGYHSKVHHDLSGESIIENMPTDLVEQIVLAPKGAENSDV